MTMNITHVSVPFSYDISVDIYSFYLFHPRTHRLLTSCTNAFCRIFRPDDTRRQQHIGKTIWLRDDGDGTTWVDYGENGQCPYRPRWMSASVGRGRSWLQIVSNSHTVFIIYTERVELRKNRYQTQYSGLWTDGMRKADVNGKLQETHSIRREWS